MPITKINSDGLNSPLGVGSVANPVYDLHVLSASGASGTLSLSGATTTGGPSYIIMGNNDSAGVSGPNVIVAANRTLALGVGTSFTAAGAGTFSPQLTVSPTGAVTVGGYKTSFGDPANSVGGTTGGLELKNGPLISNTTLSSTLSPNKTIYVESAAPSTSYNAHGLMSYVYGLPNGGPSGVTVNLCYTSWSYGWASDWCVIELFETYYLNTGYRRYMYYSGYQPTFAEATGYAHGRTDISLSNTWIGQYQNGTTGTPGTATDVTYWKGRLDVTIPAYWGGFVKITTNHTAVQSMNSSYQIQFI